VFRILLIGDSFTVGANVQEREAYGQVLEQLLNESTSKPIEVVNTGVGGWNPYQYAQFLEHYGAQYEPDLILVGLFVGNDIYVDQFSFDQTLTAVMGRRVSRAAAADAGIGLRVWLYEHSHIYRALLNTKPGDETYVRPDSNCAEFTDLYIAIQKERVPAHLAAPSPELQAIMQKSVAEIGKMQQLAAAMGSKLVVAIFPDENQLNPALQQRVIPAAELARYDFDMPQRELRAQLAARGIPSLDLLDAFRNDSRCLYMNDTHWVPAGHRLVAEQLRDYLRAQQLVP
jgi:lysophospholipase L1-like esterase